ncbi:MAG: glutamate formimidoyltransferase [Elusimicrobiota bacterium]|jgi:glutamate formiminotransferase/formiminotetrahydrofolate cyclodeaminase|nr:glutamate formimidoyltransferase [Elusimicrobiota bacterium]
MENVNIKNQLVECVPNFSEGRDNAVIKQITDAIESVEGIKLLDVDAGIATNRTVVTFVGAPAAVEEAAFCAVKKAGELIDMRRHKGAHPRIGATDVLPIIPISEITLEECAQIARRLAKRIYEELGVPTYNYEAAANRPERKNLAVCRRGEYEGLEKRISDPDEAPDFGPGKFTEQAARSGATVVGARDFLLAVNYNLNTTSSKLANEVAFDVREKGRAMREGGKPNGKIIKDENGNTVFKPGTLKGTKAIGWFIDEYAIAQVSMNITDRKATPLYIAFEEVSRAAAARGLRVSGTEIIGLLPKDELINAAKYFLRKQKRSAGVCETELMKIAVKSMGLSDLAPFKPEEKVIEYLLEGGKKNKKLIAMTCKNFAEETASESPAPGGGSISAYAGALGAALAAMVANLSAAKAGWEDRLEEFSAVAERGQRIMTELLDLVDEDTAAFNKIMAVFSMPKNTEEEKSARAKALQSATLYATQVPLKTMRAAFEVFSVARDMASNGNPNSVSDAGVSALMARSAVLGAELNVKINAAGLQDRAVAKELTEEASDISAKAGKLEKEILKIVNEKIGK